MSFRNTSNLIMVNSGKVGEDEGADVYLIKEKASSSSLVSKCVYMMYIVSSNANIAYRFELMNSKKDKKTSHFPSPLVSLSSPPSPLSFLISLPTCIVISQDKISPPPTPAAAAAPSLHTDTYAPASQSYFSGGGAGMSYGDIESGGAALYPGVQRGEQMIRLGFILGVDETTPV